jgi:hypothetical protein
MKWSVLFLLMMWNTPSAEAGPLFTLLEHLFGWDQKSSNIQDKNTPTKDLQSLIHQTVFDGRMKDMGWNPAVQYSDFNSYYQQQKPPLQCTPWQAAQFPHLGVRLDYFIQKTFSADQLKSGASPDAVSDETGKPVSFNNREQVLQFLLEDSHKLQFHPSASSLSISGLSVLEPIVFNKTQDALSSHTGFSLAACALVLPLQAQRCHQALQESLGFLRPRGPITLIPLLKQTLENPSRYLRGLAIMAKKVTDKATSIQPGTQAPLLGDLMTDLVDSFIKAGEPETLAHELAWNTLALYASRGANFYPLDVFVQNMEQYRWITSMKIISMGLSVLDMVAAADGKTYSLPRGIEFTGPLHKPYHFWMSAFIARKLSKEYNAGIGESVAFILQTGYQLFGQISGREQLFELTLQEGAHGLPAQKIRLDHVLGYAGAMYGARAKSNLKLDLNRAFQKSIQLARHYRPIPMQESLVFSESRNLSESVQRDPSLLRFYIRWVQFIRPLGTFRSLQRQNICQFIWNPLRRVQKKHLSEST